MATIDSLVEPFTEMSAAEQQSLIHSIRERRRTKPESTKKYRKSAKGKRTASTKISGGTAKISPEALLDGMSSDDKEKLLRELGVR